MKLLSITIAAAVLVLAAAVATSAETITVEFGGSSVDVNVFDAASRGQTVAQWYNFDSGNSEPLRDSAATAEGLETSNTAVFAFVRGTDGLALATIFDKSSDGSGGSVTMTGTCRGASCADLTYALADDSNEGPQNINGEMPFGGNWVWYECCTDGAVISGLGSCEDLSVSLKDASGLSNGAVLVSSTGGLNFEVVASSGAATTVRYVTSEGCTAGPCNVESVAVTIGSQQVIANVFNAAARGQTVAQWYNFDSQPSIEPFRDSAATAEGLETSNTAVWAFVRGTDGLALALIFDKPSDGTGGKATVNGNCNGDCSNLQLIVADDANEGPQTINGEGSFTGSWVWYECCTDGMALGPFGGCQTFSASLSKTSGLSSAIIASSTCGGTEWQVAATGTVSDLVSFEFGEECVDPVLPGDCQCDKYVLNPSCDGTTVSSTNSHRCVCVSFNENADDSECSPATPDMTVTCP